MWVRVFTQCSTADRPRGEFTVRVVQGSSECQDGLWVMAGYSGDVDDNSSGGTELRD